MKKLFFLKQVCGLVIGAAGILAPLGAAQADHDYINRYSNGYLNDPYSNEVAPDTQSVMGAQGPVRDDTAAFAGQEQFRNDQPIDLYTGYTGAEGPIRGSALTAKPMMHEKFTREFSVELSGE